MMQPATSTILTTSSPGPVAGSDERPSGGVEVDADAVDVAVGEGVDEGGAEGGEVAGGIRLPGVEGPVLVEGTVEFEGGGDETVVAGVVVVEVVGGVLEVVAGVVEVVDGVTSEVVVV